MVAPAIVPVLKAILPHLASIIASAIPAFTSKKSSGDSADPNTKAILEVQTAVTNNAESIKSLAEQLQQAVSSVAELSTSIEERFSTQERVLAEVRNQLIQSKETAKRAYFTAGISLLASASVIIFLVFRHTR